MQPVLNFNGKLHKACCTFMINIYGHLADGIFSLNFELKLRTYIHEHFIFRTSYTSVSFLGFLYYIL